MIRNAWYMVGYSSEYEKAKLHGHKVAGKAIVMWRNEHGSVVAFDGRCAHKRFPLWEGRFTKPDILECAYHGFCYGADGRCVSIPAKRSGPPPKTASLQPFPVTEQNGVVWVWPGEPERAENVVAPNTEEIGSDNWDSRGSTPMEVAASYRLLVENLLDITHFYPLHEGNIGDYANSQIPVRLERGMVGGCKTVKVIREAEDYKLPPMLNEWFGFDVVDRHHTHHMVNPGLTRVQLRLASPGKLGTEGEKGYVLYHFHTPVDRTHHIWRWSMNCPAGVPYAKEPAKTLTQKIVEGFPSVVEQDLWALEKQQEMMAYAEEGYEEVHIKTDGAVVMARRILEELELQEAQPDERELAQIRSGRVEVDN